MRDAFLIRQRRCRSQKPYCICLPSGLSCVYSAIPLRRLWCRIQNETVLQAVSQSLAIFRCFIAILQSLTLRLSSEDTSVSTVCGSAQWLRRTRTRLQSSGLLLRRRRRHVRFRLCSVRAIVRTSEGQQELIDNRLRG